MCAPVHRVLARVLHVIGMLLLVPAALLGKLWDVWLSLLLLGTIRLLLLLLMLFDRLADRTTNSTSRVLAAMVMAQDVTAAHAMSAFTFLLFARRYVLP